MTFSEALKRENNNIDLLRLFAATLVLWSHSFPLTFGDGSLEPVGQFFKITYAGKLGVAIFFFLSGLLVANSLIKKKSVPKFVISRFFRIWPGYLILLLVTVFVVGPFCTTLTTGDYFHSIQTWKYLIRNSIMSIDYSLPGCFADNAWANDVNGSIWSLPVEVSCYIFMLGAYLLLAKLGENKKRVANVILLALIFISLIPTDAMGAFFNWTYFPGLGTQACFAAGVFFAVNQEKIELDFRLLLGFFLLTTVCWRYVSVSSLLLSVSISLLLVYISTTKPVLALKLKYDISYGIYIWHFLIQQVLFMYLGKINVYLFFLISLVITVVISVLSYALVEKPCMDLGYRLGKKADESNFKYKNALWIIFLFFVCMVIAKTH